MAKRKDSVALFEVITATRKRQEAAAAGSATPSILRTPKWWFKSKNKRADQTSGNVPHDPTAVPAEVVSQSAPQLAPPVETTNGSAAMPGLVQRVPLPPERVTIPAAVPAVADHGHEGDPFGLEIPEQADRPRRNWLNRFGGGGQKLGLDPDRREVTVRFRYTTAIIVGFAICVAVGLAYVTGRQTNKASAGPNPVSSAAVKNGPVLAHVIDIGPTEKPPENVEEPDAPPAPSGKNPDDAARGKAAPPAASQRVGAHPAMPGPADGVETAMPRIKGLNYVIVQSYPDLRGALEAQKALEAEGIPCTVETGPADWVANPEWRSVIGIHGFARMKDVPAYKRYVAAIESVSRKFAGNSKFKKFEPMAYKWK
jgi:hypothetical protein